MCCGIVLGCVDLIFVLWFLPVISSLFVVQGCDASILLNSNELAKNPEMVSSRNFGVRKLDKINHIKFILEMECPGQVSCADIIALAAKESVFVTGGPDVKIPLGRKDSFTCSSQQADAHLPAAGIAVDELLRIFASYRMNLEESISILGIRHNRLSERSALNQFSIVVI